MYSLSIFFALLKGCVLIQDYFVWTLYKYIQKSDRNKWYHIHVQKKKEEEQTNIP